MKITRPLMLHFPTAFGLRPRPMDDYDRDCLRLYLAIVGRNYAAESRARNAIYSRHGRGPDVDDSAFGHGHTVAQCAIRAAE